MRVVVLEPLGVSQERLAELAAPLGEAGHKVEFYATRERNWAVMAERASDADVVVIANHALKGDVVRLCPNLKMISVAFTGVDHLDLEACRTRGILVSNAAGYATSAVAELTLGLALALFRQILPADGAARSGGTLEGLRQRELRGKTFGVVGTGAIGKEVARLAAAFGCSVLGHRRSVPEGTEEEGILHVSLEDLLRRSDLVSLHVPLTDATRGLIGEDALALMKPDGVLINVARGPVVDQQALARALREGRLGGAGVDVFDLEPPLPPDHVLFEVPRLILTPHLGYATEEALEERARIALENVLAWTQGRPRNVVCP